MWQPIIDMHKRNSYALASRPHMLLGASFVVGAPQAEQKTAVAARPRPHAAHWMTWAGMRWAGAL